VDLPVSDAPLALEVATREGLVVVPVGRLQARLIDPNTGHGLDVHLSASWPVPEALAAVCEALLDWPAMGMPEEERRYGVVRQARLLLGRGTFGGPPTSPALLAGYLSAQLQGPLAEVSPAWSVLGLAMWTDKLAPQYLPAARALAGLDQCEDQARARSIAGRPPRLPGDRLTGSPSRSTGL
jgi:hypothetical protein